MTPDEEILKLLQSWSPEVTSLLKRAGYFDLDFGQVKKEKIAKEIGLNPEGRLYRQVLQASKEKNGKIWDIVLNEHSLREFKDGARNVAKILNIPFSQYDWNNLAQGFFKEHGLQFIKNLTQTDIDSLRERIQYDFNLNPRDFAKKYASSYSCAPSRLQRIKRTETHTCSEAGGFGFADEAGATTKTWNCTPKGKWPRATHRAVWHETVPIDQPFSNGQMWPMDVNCRCYLTYGFGKAPTTPWKAKAGSRAPIVGVSPADFVKVRDQLPKELKAFLTPYTADEYRAKNVKLRMHESGNGGYGLNGDELISVFSNPGAHLGSELVTDAIANGAKKLDCLGDRLAIFYNRNGFKVVKIDKWNDQYAPKDWDYSGFGKPNLYYMELI